MANSVLKVALMLTAYDRMSSVSNTASNNVIRDMQRAAKAATANVTGGIVAFEAGKQIMEMTKPVIDAYAEMEQAGARLRSAIMRDGGIINEQVYAKMIQQSKELALHYANTPADYIDMMRVLKENGMQEVEILGKVGEATEKLSIVMETQPVNAAKLASHMRRDMGIAGGEMLQMMDLIARIKNAGVGISGVDVIGEMDQFFSKASLSAEIMKAQGIEQSKQLAAIAVLFIRRGLSGQTVGTNFRRMLDTMRNPKALGEVIGEARKLGIELDLFDKKTKQFKGFANMVAEFNKLKGLPVHEIDKITHAFGGRQGLSNDFIALLSVEGVKYFNETMEQLYAQGTLDQKIGEIMNTIIYRQKQIEAAKRNLQSDMGSTVAVPYENMQKTLRGMLMAVDRFVLAHPKLTKFLIITTAVVGMLVAMAGAFMIIKGGAALLMLSPMGGVLRLLWFIISKLLLPVIWSLIRGMTMMAIRGAIAAVTFIAPWLPVIAIFVAIGLVIYGIHKIVIKYFGSWGNFFSVMWAKIKNIFKAGVDIVKALLLNFTGIGLIVKHWDKIASFFHAVWEKVKKIFTAVLGWVLGLGIKFFEAGRNIVINIGKGISNAAHLAVDKMRVVAQKLRNFWPFSPAKEGPLRDIHKVRLIETIADTIRPELLVNKMRSAVGAFAGLDVRSGSMAAQTASGVTVHLQYSPQITVMGGGADAANGILDLLRKDLPGVVNMIQDELDKRNRKRY